MPQETRKSTAYSVIIVCLTLIAIPSFYALLWQPTFTNGYVQVPFGEGSLLFSLWRFGAAAGSLLVISGMVYTTAQKNYPRTYVLLLVGLGLTFIVCLAPEGYGSHSSAEQSRQAVQLYRVLITALKVLMAIALLLLVVQWKRHSGTVPVHPTTPNR